MACRKREHKGREQEKQQYQHSAIIYVFERCFLGSFTLKSVSSTLKIAKCDVKRQAIRKLFKTSISRKVMPFSGAQRKHTKRIARFICQQHKLFTFMLFLLHRKP